MDGLFGLTSDVLDRARRSRDARFDGKFIIAITSTGIYCRPICPARVSKDSNVRYYATAAEAAAAGFRPCLRCRPEAAPGSPAWLGTSAVVRRALRLIEDGALDDGSVDELANRLGVGVRHLSRLFAQHVGAPPVAVAYTRRLHFAKRLLDETSWAITQIALASGFGSLRRFNDVFRATYHRSPRELRKRRATGGGDSGDAEIVLRLAYRPPYDWPYLHAFLANRAIRGVEGVDERGYTRAVRTGGGHAVLCIRPAEGADALELHVQGAAPSDLLPLLSSVRRMFDLTADPARIVVTLRGDTQLRPLIARRPGLRIPGAWEPFECGVRAILGQEISVAAARTILGRLIESAGQPIDQVVPGISHLFPSPDSIANANLGDVGLTRSRRDALQCFARAVRDGAINFDEPSENVVRALADLPGIGRWIAEYVALRGLGEPDAFPYGDPILRRQATTGKAPLTAQELEARSEIWRPFRGYAVFHLWEARGDPGPPSFHRRRQPVEARLRA
jgi:AraC family transcriptional regulator, regulatory protein of adaptative response / DNA-3-methyladenine glycosylase II